MPEINFCWDPLSDNILQERDDTGAVTAEYTAEPGLYGNIISQNRGGVESQFHYDAQGSTVAVTDDNQNVTDTIAYSAFGEVTVRTGTTDVPFQYIGRQGYYTDGLTGQIMTRRRPYEPTRARWLAAKAVGGGIRYNGFAYGLNAPTSWADPSGRLQSGGTQVLLPSSNVRKDAITCPGCGNYDIEWLIEPSGAMDVMYFVQLLCFTFDVEQCVDSISCPDTTCKPTGKGRKGSCCIIEEIGLAGPPGVGPGPAHDQWGYTSIVSRRCHGRGFVGHWAFLYGFPPDSKSATTIAAWPLWIKPPENGSNVFRCLGVSFNVGKYFQWDGKALPPELQNANKDIAERTQYGAGHEFDCCPIPENDFTGALAIVIRGGVEEGEPGYECGKEKPVPIEIPKDM